MINLIYRIDKMKCKYSKKNTDEYLKISKENIAHIKKSHLSYASHHF